MIGMLIDIKVSIGDLRIWDAQRIKEELSRCGKDEISLTELSYRIVGLLPGFVPRFDKADCEAIESERKKALDIFRQHCIDNEFENRWDGDVFEDLYDRDSYQIKVASLRTWFAKQYPLEQETNGAVETQPDEPATDAGTQPDELTPKQKAVLAVTKALHGDCAHYLEECNTPKQAIIKWLTEHKDELGLKSNRAIEEVAKMANWYTKPGAPKGKKHKTKVMKASERASNIKK
jgi:hypothetical protein